jgi:Ca2+/Na+ antiporter
MITPIRSDSRRWLQARYPIWSSRWVALQAVFVAIVAGVLIFSFGERSLLVRTEMTLAVIAAALFCFLSYGLYCGIRIRKEHAAGQPAAPGWWWPSRRRRKSGRSDGNGGAELFDFVHVPDIELDFDEGILGWIAATLLSIVVMILLAVLAAVLIHVVWAVAAVLGLALFWIFNRALRRVFARSRQCRGRLVPSLGWAFIYTVAYTGWLFALVWLVHRLAGSA